MVTLVIITDRLLASSPMRLYVARQFLIRLFRCGYKDMYSFGISESVIRLSQGNNGSCRSSTARITMTLSSLFRRLALAVGAMDFTRTKPMKSWQRRKRTCWNTVPTARMPSIRCTLAAKNFRRVITLGLPCVIGDTYRCKSCY